MSDSHWAPLPRRRVCRTSDKLVDNKHEVQGLAVPGDGWFAVVFRQAAGNEADERLARRCCPFRQRLLSTGIFAFAPRILLTQTKLVGVTE